MDELYNTGGWTGLASSGIGTIDPLSLGYFAASAPAITALPEGAAGAIGAVAEDGATTANPYALVPNLSTQATQGLAGSANKLGSWFTGNVPAENVGNIMNSGGTFDAAKNTITDASGSLYNLNGDGSLTRQSMFDQGMKFLNDNSKGLETGGKIIGGLGSLYYQNQAAGLAKQQLNDQRANTAYNRNRQNTGDANLASASNKVFGTGVA